MRTRLLYPDRSLDMEAPEPPLGADLALDLGLEVIIEAMAAGNADTAAVARRVLLTGLQDPDAIRYRQAAFADALVSPDVVRSLHAMAMEAIASEARIWGAFLDRYPEPVLGRATRVLELFLGYLRRLRMVAERSVGAFGSAAFRSLFAELAAELDDDYLADLDDHLERLRFRGGIVLTAGLGVGNRGAGYVLRKPQRSRPPWRQRVRLLDRAGYVYQVPDDDDVMVRALNELKARGIASAASALARSTDHIRDFFRGLHAELAWYVGCLNLHDRLTAARIATCVPVPTAGGGRWLEAQGLVDSALALLRPQGLIGNDLVAGERTLIVITGANQGGKSTFLRSLGQAQLMLQAGLFVAADRFEADVRDRVFTHFKREEDPELRRGKLDEELARMSAIVDGATPISFVLLNESFASTSEREGSEIARQVVTALVDAGVRVAMVTHLHDLAASLHRDAVADGVFLQAEREVDGRRTFRMVEAAPLPTSFAADLYREVFGASPDGGGPPSGP